MVADVRSPAIRAAQVLVVEDSLAQGELLTRALDEQGFGSVTRLEHGMDAALSFLERQVREGPASLPHLLLVDLKLSQGNGIELLRRLRIDRRLAHLPVIMLTTSDDPKDINASYSCGVNGYVVKPATFEGLLLLTRDLCAYWLKWNRLASASPSAFPDEETPSLC